MRVVVELIHIATGIAAAFLIAALSAWAYPRGTHDIWLVTYVAIGAVVLMGVGPVRRAWIADRQGAPQADG